MHTLLDIFQLQLQDKDRSLDLQELEELHIWKANQKTESEPS